MKIKFISMARPASSGQKLIALIIALALLALLTMFAVVLLPIVLLGAAYLWWKTRAVRSQWRQMQAQMQQMHEQAQRATTPQEHGEIIEGEVVRVYEKDVRIGR